MINRLFDKHTLYNSHAPATNDECGIYNWHSDTQISHSLKTEKDFQNVMNI